MNAVMVHLNQRAGFAPYNPYAMKVDRRNRNYYNYKGFRHLVRNRRNKGIENRIRKSRRLEYENNGQSN